MSAAEAAEATAAMVAALAVEVAAARAAPWAAGERDYVAALATTGGVDGYRRGQDGEGVRWRWR